MASAREERWRGEVTNELRHIRAQLDRMDQRLEAFETHVAETMTRHLEYHTANEHRWGLQRWAHRHPVRFALVVAGIFLWLHWREPSQWPLLLRETLSALGR